MLTIVDNLNINRKKRSTASFVVEERLLLRSFIYIKKRRGLKWTL